MKRYFEHYCDSLENVENYETAKKDNFKGWNCHHRLETHTSDGERRLVDITVAELKALGMYWHRPAKELIFLTKAEHNKLHKKGNSYMLGKHHSAESKKKMSEAQKGKHIGNTATKGMHWYNNGKINKLCYECPDGFFPGRRLLI